MARRHGPVGRAPAGPSRRELRARERDDRRAEAAARAAERDAALERYATDRGDSRDDSGADEDPWAPSSRRD